MTSRRTSAVLSFAIDCGSSRDTSICATTTASRAPTRHSPEPTRQDKIFAKLTWKLTPSLQLVQSFHDEVGINPRSSDDRDAVRSDHAAAHLGAGHDLRPSDAHVVGQYRVGRARRTVRLLPRGRIAHRQPDDTEPVRPRDGCHQRRSATVRRADDHAHDRQGDPQPLPARSVGRRSPVEDGRAGRTGRAPRGQPHSDRREVRRQQRTAVSGHLERSLQRRRRGHHGLRVRERRHHGGGAADDQCRSAVRPQPRHQSGPARARSGRARNRSDRPRPGNAVHLEHRVAAPGCHHEAQRRRPNGAAGELRAVQPGRADRRAGALPSRWDPDHDEGLRSGDRRLHAHRLGGRSEDQPAARSPDARAAHGRVLRWRRSRGRPPARGGDRLRPKGRQQLHRMDGRRRSVS